MEDRIDRRDFLLGTLAASTFAAAPAAQEQTPVARPREYYQLRRYALQSGPQVAMTEKYISEALIPSLAKKSGPVGAFRLDVGPETPTFYVLIPIHEPGMAATLEIEFAQDADYVNAA